MKAKAKLGGTLVERLLWASSQGEKFSTVERQAAEEIERLQNLEREVAGTWTAFERGLRDSIGNTNYNIIREKLRT